jgi:hypothetical protein
LFASITLELMTELIPGAGPPLTTMPKLFLVDPLLVGMSDTLQKE